MVGRLRSMRDCAVARPSWSVGVPWWHHLDAPCPRLPCARCCRRSSGKPRIDDIAPRLVSQYGRRRCRPYCFVRNSAGATERRASITNSAVWIFDTGTLPCFRASSVPLSLVRQASKSRPPAKQVRGIQRHRHLRQTHQRQLRAEGSMRSRSVTAYPCCRGNAPRTALQHGHGCRPSSCRAPSRGVAQHTCRQGSIA